MKNKIYKIIVIFEQDKNGCSAFCPDLKNCKTEGLTLDKVFEDIQKVIKTTIKNMPPEERYVLTAKQKFCSKGKHEIFTRFRKRLAATFR